MVGAAGAGSGVPWHALQGLQLPRHTSACFCLPSHDCLCMRTLNVCMCGQLAGVPWYSDMTTTQGTSYHPSCLRGCFIWCISTSFPISCRGGGGSDAWGSLLYYYHYGRACTFAGVAGCLTHPCHWMP